MPDAGANHIATTVRELKARCVVAPVLLRRGCLFALVLAPHVLPVFPRYTLTLQQPQDQTEQHLKEC